VRPNLERPVDLAAGSAVRTPTFGAAIVLGPAAFAAAAVENDLDLLVLPESLDQIPVKAELERETRNGERLVRRSLDGRSHSAATRTEWRFGLESRVRS